MGNEVVLILKDKFLDKITDGAFPSPMRNEVVLIVARTELSVRSLLVSVPYGE